MKFASRVVAYGVCSVFAACSSVAFAQMSDMSGQSCSDMQMMRNQCGQPQKNKKTEQKNTPQQPSQYPNATRQEPKGTSVDDKTAKPLNEGLDAVNSGDAATAQKDLQPIADGSDSAYAKAKALGGLALIKYNSGDTKGAIALQKQAIELNSLSNDDYFPALYALAQMYMADEEYAQTISTLDQWLQQSGKQSADAYALKGNALYRLQKYPDAVTAIQKAKSLSDKPQDSWDQILMASYTAMDRYDEAGKLAEQMLAKDPTNPKLLMNAVTIYTNAKQYDKALALLARARAGGAITDETTYLNMAKLYFNLAVDGQDTKSNALKSAQVVEEGMGKGIVKPTADNYKLLGDAYTLAGDKTKADAAYDKGGVPHPTAHKDGKKK